MHGYAWQHFAHIGPWYGKNPSSVSIKSYRTSNGAYSYIHTNHTLSYYLYLKISLFLASFKKKLNITYCIIISLFFSLFYLFQNMFLK